MSLSNPRLVVSESLESLGNLSYSLRGKLQRALSVAHVASLCSVSVLTLFV